MLELRPCCEHCGKSLPNDSSEAMICSYECTFCSTCVDTVLENVCPNCGGGFEARPTRPNSQLAKYPMKSDRLVKPVSVNPYVETNKGIEPRMR
jgi:uncharacterized protein